MPRDMDEFITSLRKELEIANIYDVRDLIAEFEEEIRGFNGYLNVLALVLKNRYPKHKRFLKVVESVRFQGSLSLMNLGGIKGHYQTSISNFEHRMGKLERRKVKAVAPFALSFEELLGMYPEERILEDVFDE